MRLSSLLLVVVGLGAAGGSVYFAQDILAKQAQRDTQTEEAATIGVLVAGRDIAFGQAIEAQLITTIHWPRESTPAGVFTDPADLLPAEGVEPRRARKAIAQGELILNTRVSDWGEKVTIVQSLSPNQRAMAIKVDAETAVGGFVTPGDFVDVLLTQGRNEKMRTVTILQNVRVIGVDQDSNEGNDAPEIARTVTVEVTPDEGQRLALAQQAGTLSLTLRNQIGAEDKPLELLRLSDLLQEVSPVPENAAAPKITVRRGIDVTDENL